MFKIRTSLPTGNIAKIAALVLTDGSVDLTDANLNDEAMEFEIEVSAEYIKEYATMIPAIMGHMNEIITGVERIVQTLSEIDTDGAGQARAERDARNGDFEAIIRRGAAAARRNHRDSSDSSTDDGANGAADELRRETSDTSGDMEDSNG
jgi:hypothetical protein